MKFARIYYTFAMLLFIVIMAGGVFASDLSDSDSIVSADESLMGVNTTFNDDSLMASQDSSLNDNLEDSGEIVVNDWEELRDYCSLDDKNYVLKLKENTNYYPEDPTSDEYQIVINNNVTIKGSSGAYIGDSSPNARNITYMPIKVNDNSGIGITLLGVDFKWISTSYQTDGVFLTMAGNVNNLIKDCYFHNITTNIGHSSILHIKFGTLNVENCTFVNCTTDYGCISVYSPKDDPTKICTGARMDIRDSYFEGNYAKTEPGCINNCGILNVYNTTFYRNTAFWWAGAIHTHGGANTTIYHSNFTDNLAGWNGGALYTYSYLQVYDSIFIGNNCTTNNGGGAIGACKYLHSPEVYIKGCLFKDNENLCWGLNELSTSGTGRGGAISIMDTGNLEVYDTTFIKNSASIGTAICAITSSQYGSPDIRIIGNTFINHTRIGDVLKITVGANSVCDIRDNYYYNNSIEFSKLKLEAGDPVDGKVLFNIDPVLKNPKSYDTDILEKSKYDVYVDGVYNTTISGMSFYLNFKNGETHRVYVVPSISNSQSNEVLAGIARTYIYVSQKNGKDTNNGLTRNTPVATIAKSIELARAHENIIIIDGTFKETELTIDYNLTITGENDVTLTSRGLIFSITNGDVAIKNINFKNSELSATGKSKEKIIRQDSTGILTLENCLFENNKYSALIESMGSVECDNLTFIGNTAGLIKANSLILLNSLFERNTAVASNYESLLLPQSKTVKLDVRDSIFKKNTVQKGCIKANGGSSSVTDCYFEENAVSSDKARASCIFNEGTTIDVKSSTFVNNNDLGSYSSFIYASSGTTTIYESIIINNSYQNNHGVIYGGNSGLKSLTCNYNWWGNTLDNLEKPLLPSSAKCDYWLVLNATPSKEVLGIGEASKVLFDLNYIVDSEKNISEYFADGLPQFTLTISTINGNSVKEVTMENSRAEVPFELIEFKQGSVIANYRNVSVVIDFYVTQIDPDFQIDVDNITVGETANINVTTISKIKSIVMSVDGKNYTINFVNGFSNISISNLSSGLHEILINYEGNSLYYKSKINKTFEVFKTQVSVSPVVNNVYYYGDEIKIVLTTNNDAKGKIDIVVGKFRQTKDINNAKVEFTLPLLDAGHYTLNYEYSGDEKYFSKNATVSFEVKKYDSATSLSASELILGEDITLTAALNEDATGNVTFVINGESKIVNIKDSKAVYVIPNISKGDYTIKAIYNGDNKYLSSNDSIQFSVGKLKSNVNVHVGDISYGNEASVEITVTPLATGNVTVNIDGKSGSAELISGKAIINISDLSAGDKKISVLYNGDENYLPSQNNTTFKISKINPSFSVIANSVMVGEDVVVAIDFNKDMTGNFTYNLNGESKTYSISQFAKVNNWILKNLKPGNYTVNVIYNGDVNYNSDKNFTQFKVYEYPQNQISNEGINTKNTGKSEFESNANGFVDYIIELENAVNGSIVIDADGNIYFASDTDLFAYSSSGELLWKYSSNDLADSSFAGVTIGRDMVISPMNGNKLFFINMTSGNQNKPSNMYQGSSFFSPIMDENYTVYIVSEYLHSDGDYKLVIILYEMWQTSLTPTMISIGKSKPVYAPVLIDNEHVAIMCEDGLKIIDVSNKYVSSLNFVSSYARPVVGMGGAIYAFSDNSIINIIDEQQQWKTKVTGSIGKYLVLDSEMGYIYSVNSNGVLYRYDIGNGEEEFIYDFKEDVSSNMVIDENGYIYLGTESGKFYAFDDNCNMLWKVNLDGKITGNPIIDKEGSIYVIVNESKIIKLSRGELLNSDLNVYADNIFVDDNLTVKVTFNSQITGKITVSIEGYVSSENLIAMGEDLILTVPDLPAGNYTVNITYSGDMRFRNDSVAADFKVSKINIASDADDIIDIPQSSNDGDMTYSINLKGATGNLTVVVDGTPYNTVDLVDGKASITVKDLSSGNHNISIIYSGDEKYSKIIRNTSVNIPEPAVSHIPEPAVSHIPVIKMEANDFTMLYTSGAMYSVRVTSDGNPVSGKSVTFVINGKQVAAVTDINGYASVKIDLPPNSAEYTLTASFNDVKITNNVKVNSILSAKNIKVKKSAKSLKIKVTVKKVNGKYIKSKKLTLKLNGKKYMVKTNNKGVATFKIPKKAIKKLKAGKKYKYNVLYLKDTITKKITVKK